MRLTRIVAVRWWFFCLLLLASLTAFAQEETARPSQTGDEQQSEEQQSKADQEKQNQAGQSSQAPAETTTATPDVSFEKPAVNLATGQILSKTRSPFSWRNFSLMSVDFLQVYDSNYLFLKDNPVSAQAGAVEGLLVYSLRKRRFDVNLQYRPQIWVAAEDQQYDYQSHSVDFHSFRRLSQTWSFNLSDQFQYSPNRGRLNQVGFSSDYGAGLSTQNPFLAAAQEMISNSTDVALDHRLGTHDRLEISGRYQYIHFSGEPNTAPTDPFSAANEQKNAGGDIGWRHTWRRDNEFGIQYSYDRQSLQGFDTPSEFHGVLFGFSRRLRPSLLLRAGAGPVYLIAAQQTGTLQKAPSKLTYEANAALYKTFRHSGVTLSFTRDNNFTGLISDSLNDRFDATYSQHVFRRMDFIVGGAYVRQAYSVGPYLYGKSGWSEVDYRLSRAWSLYGSYTYMTQTGGGALWGPRTLITSGLRWSWDLERGQSFGKQ